MCHREFSSDGCDNFGDALGDGFRRVASSVVCTDHNHRNLRLDAFEFSVFDAPKNVLCAITANPEIRGIPLAESFGPNVLARSRPAGRDGISKEKDLRLPFFGDAQKPFVRRHKTDLRLGRLGIHFRRSHIRQLGRKRSGRNGRSRSSGRLGMSRRRSKQGRKEKE